MRRFISLLILAGLFGCVEIRTTVRRDGMQAHAAFLKTAVGYPADAEMRPAVEAAFQKALRAVQLGPGALSEDPGVYDQALLGRLAARGYDSLLVLGLQSMIHKAGEDPSPPTALEALGVKQGAPKSDPLYLPRSTGGGQSEKPMSPILDPTRGTVESPGARKRYVNGWIALYELPTGRRVWWGRGSGSGDINTGTESMLEHAAKEFVAAMSRDGMFPRREK